MPILRPLLLALTSCTLASVAAHAAPQLDPLFQDHAVLQRGKPISITGTADPGEHVSVTFAGQTGVATAGPDGRWSVPLEPLDTNDAGADMTVAGKTVITLHDILVGEVWLCSGQSNMEYTVDKSGGEYGVENAAAEIAAARYPSIRHFKVLRKASAEPADKVSGVWTMCFPESVGGFTAVGYFFARDLTERLNIPIGLVNCTWAGTPIESWMSPESLAASPSGHPAAGSEDPMVPASLYNGMIRPLTGFPIAGVIWYQGEANVGHAAEYAVRFPALIKGWRAQFGEGDFPFYWVQLANYNPPGAPGGEQWAYLREAQSKALALPMTGQAVTIDIGEPGNVMPKNKQEVGRRLALIAKAQIYSVAVDYSGPVFDKAEVDGSSMKVHFLFAGEGLTASGKPLQSFELAGADKVYHPAGAVIRGDTIIVRSAQVLRPVAVRYGWRNSPDANLFNGAGLPAAPFRSDAW